MLFDVVLLCFYVLIIINKLNSYVIVMEDITTTPPLVLPPICSMTTHIKTSGYLEIILGPMWSGKTWRDNNDGVRNC